MMYQDIFITDIHHCMDALEDFIIRRENELIDSQAGDKEWSQLEKYKATMKNLQYVESIYG